MALWRNFSAVASVAGALLPPAQLDQRFFLIQQTVRDHSLMIVSEVASPLPLYLYTKGERMPTLTPLATVQLIEEKEARPVLNGHRFLSRVYALRRLGLFPAPVADGGDPAGAPIGAVFATLRMDTGATFADDATRLLRVAELGPQGAQRQLDRRLVWIGQDQQEENTKTTTINFVDLHASAAVPQLFYELLFGNPAHFRAPYFDQPMYQLRLQDLQHAGGAPAPQQQQEVLARINAVSPLDARINYTLVSPEARSAFSVVPTTGDLVLTHPVVRSGASSSSSSAEYCLNLVATDAEGRQARVPVQVVVRNDLQQQQQQPPQDCTLFPADWQVHAHEFKPVKQEQDVVASASTEQHQQWTTATVPEREEKEEQTTRRPSTVWHHPLQQMSTVSPMVVVQVDGDATLPPAVASASPHTAASETSYEMVSSASEEAEEGERDTAATRTPALAAVSQRFLQTAHVPQRAGPSITRTPPPLLHISGAGGGRTSGVRGGGSSSKNGTGERVGVLSAQREGKSGDATGQAMAEMACRLRSTKPIWALICDMAKTVYRTTILNA